MVMWWWVEEKALVNDEYGYEEFFPANKHWILPIRIKCAFSSWGDENYGYEGILSCRLDGGKGKDAGNWNIIMFLIEKVEWIKESLLSWWEYWRFIAILFIQNCFHQLLKISVNYWIF